MSTTPSRVDASRSLPRLDRVCLVAVLLGVAGIAWAFTVARMGAGGSSHGMDRMAEAAAGFGGLSSFGLTWVLMMAAMMLPSLAPTVLTHARVQRTHGPRTRRFPTGATLVFVVGYLVSWSVVGVLGYLVVEAVRSLDLGWLTWNQGGRYVAGGVIVGAALYQLVGLKRACLRHCRTQLIQVKRWRPGRLGALRTGLEHGVFCIGSSGALMLVPVVLGLMSLGWMIFAAALVGLEKLLPWEAAVNRGIAVSLVVLGIGVMFAPMYVPGLGMLGH